MSPESIVDSVTRNPTQIMTESSMDTDLVGTPQIHTCTTSVAKHISTFFERPLQKGMIEMLLKNDQIRQICVNNKIPIMIRTNFIHIKKYQSQEADNCSKVCYSNNFRKKITCHLSLYLWQKKQAI